MIKIYGTTNCGNCKAIKRMFDNSATKYTYINIDNNETYIDKFYNMGLKSLPVVEYVKKNGETHTAGGMSKKAMADYNKFEMWQAQGL